MDGVTALAQHIKNRDNPSLYTPMFGKTISLPQLKIQLGSRILLDADDVKATFDIYEKIHHDGYIEHIRVQGRLHNRIQTLISKEPTVNQHRRFYFLLEIILFM